MYCIQSYTREKDMNNLWSQEWYPAIGDAAQGFGSKGVGSTLANWVKDSFSRRTLADMMPSQLMQSFNVHSLNQREWLIYQCGMVLPPRHEFTTTGQMLLLVSLSWLPTKHHVTSMHCACCLETVFA